MGEDILYDTARHALWVLTLASLPALVPALVIGLVIGLIQAATSVQEATLTFIPKLLGVFLAILLFGGVTGGMLMDFTQDIMAAIPQMAR